MQVKKILLHKNNIYGDSDTYAADLGNGIYLVDFETYHHDADFNNVYLSCGDYWYAFSGCGKVYYHSFNSVPHP